MRWSYALLLLIVKTEFYYGSRNIGESAVRNRIDDPLYGKSGQIPDLELTDINPMATTKPLIRALRAQAKKSKTELAGERLEDYWLGDVSVDDAYVYFVK